MFSVPAFYLLQFNSAKYLGFTNFMPRFAIRTVCNLLDSEIVKIRNKEEAHTAYGLAGGKSFWLGLRRGKRDWYWDTSTYGTRTHFFFWRTGQPDITDNKNCVYAAYAGEWMAADCDNFRSPKMVGSRVAQNPEHRTISDVLVYLEREPVMLRALQEYMREREQIEDLLLTCLEDTERRSEVEGQDGEEPVPQEQAFYEEEAEWAPLPETNDADEAENWPTEAEWAPLPESDEETEAPVAPNAVAEPVESVRELVLRTRTINIPVLATHTSVAAAPEEFHPADLGDLPEQLRRELLVPQAEPYTVVQANEERNIVCGICGRQFATLKGWRIHASRMHKQDGKFLRSLWPLPPAATRIHGRAKESGDRSSRSRLVPESVCGRDQRKAGQAPQT
ncbi:Uncharacterized protein BM_BM17612 [Brugia malayi]|uniref:C-type lectin domain-containing protein n=1 Tax=Brugia malayi TaxID=6279 RepID=A0A4E9FF33_BRUMA|nr:Uncharacterized protein BM_BM17612 [Brugia malayi]VIO95565.1 Uncharacterized protein BM_BM17612 [Brugia malayi]